nr:hypothetical protein [Gammaproteobacteria bacterium]
MESPLKRLSLPRSALVAALAAVVLAAAAWLTVDRQGAGPRAPEAAVEKTATEIAAWVGGALSAELSPLRAAAEREGAVALVAGPEAVQAAEQRLAVVHSDVLRARILPRGHSQADYHSLPPLTYASLSLLQRSESQGQAPPIEGQLLGSEQQQLALLVRLTAADGALAGHALFSL